MLRCDMFLKIESRLNIITKLISSTSPDSSSADGKRGLVWKATALTALIFVHHFLRGNPLRHQQYGVLVPMLQDTLFQMAPDFRELAFARPLLFWILSVACVTSNGLSCHGWLVERLSMSCTSYSMDWQDLRLLLTGFLWTGNEDEDKYASVWSLVEHYQKTPQSQESSITASVTRYS